MIIDFHTHIFPDRIAAKALSGLIQSQSRPIVPSTGGTRSSLLHSMEEAGIGLSVVMPVLTSPRQFDSVLRFASEINRHFYSETSPRLLSFAGIHPDSGNYAEQLRTIVREGLPGIKLHPNFQNTNFDDIRYLRIMDKASELGLIVLAHTGEDPVAWNRACCTPDMILHVLRELAPPKLVLAHLGNNFHYQESYEKLCGLNVWMDTAFAVNEIQEELFAKIVRRHGADKILFATDSPWADQKTCVERFLSFQSISETEKQLILCKNAASLLCLSDRTG